MTSFRIAEKFKSLQGEGVYTGTPMAFIRFVGCSVGKRVCSACDTDFEQEMVWRGGGEFTADDLGQWAIDQKHVCLTGGEPLDQNLDELVRTFHTLDQMVHLETSGTKWLGELMSRPVYRKKTWVCVSPKPGYHEEMVLAADEIKIIVPGLGALKHGTCEGWPGIDEAIRWSTVGKIVFLQPRNDKNDVNSSNLRLCQDIIAEHPQLRLSVQLHKVLRIQ